jgi:hypothetical protein
VSHPSLGLPPIDRTAGLPDAAARIRASAPVLAARALASAMDADPAFEARYDEAGLRGRLHDARLLAERLADAVGSGDLGQLREYADQTSPVYRRKQVPLGDLIALCEGLRVALPGTLAPGEIAPASTALDGAIDSYRWHKRLAGDAGPKNALIQFLYKGG